MVDSEMVTGTDSVDLSLLSPDGSVRKSSKEAPDVSDPPVVGKLRFWSGMEAGPWFSLLKRHHFAISPSRLPMVIQISIGSFVNSLLSRWQNKVFSKQINDVILRPDPVFIIGHWRSGTTLLHELLALDDQFIWPTTYECFSPSHFLVSAHWGRKRLASYLAPRRLSDRMPVGFDRPQEDEFAFLALGLGSPYETYAFPNHRKPERFDRGSFDEASVEAWKAGCRRFLRQVQLRSYLEADCSEPVMAPKRFLLKSPTHTASVSILGEMFPEASFIHIVRSPYEILPSMIRLRTSYCEAEGCQVPRFEALSTEIPSIEDSIFEDFLELYQNFPEKVEKIPEGRFHEIRYENLVKQPIEEMERLYTHLNLGPFDNVRQKVHDYFDGLDYKPGKNSISPDMRAEISRRWADYIARYGY